MDTKRIVYRQKDEITGRWITRIVIPAPGATRDQVMKAVPEGVAYREVDASEIPADRTFRDAWLLDLTVHMPDAREIHRGRLREDRAPRLAMLDVDHLRGRNVEAEKQRLRDVTADPRIDAAATPEELRALTLDALLGKGA